MNEGLVALKELRENGAVSFSKATISFTYLAFTKRADIIEKDLKRLEQLEIMYSNCVFEGAKQKKTLENIKELFDFDFALRFPSNQPMLRITNKRTNEYWEIPISKEEYNLLTEVLL